MYLHHLMLTLYGFELGTFETFLIWLFNDAAAAQMTLQTIKHALKSLRQFTSTFAIITKRLHSSGRGGVGVEYH